MPARVADSTMGWIPIPLVDPESLVTVEAAFKQEARCLHRPSVGSSVCGEVLRTPSKGSSGSEKDPLPADIDMTTEVPLSHFVRAPALCRELLHQTSAGRLVDLSPNGLDVTLASIELRIYCVMVVRSEEHGEAE